MEIKSNTSKTFSIISSHTNSYQAQLREMGQAIANHNVTEVKNLLAQGLNVNSLIELDKDLSVLVITSTHNKRSSLQPYLEQYFKTGITLLPCNSDKFPESFKDLLDKALKLLEEKKNLPQELIQELVQIDSNEMDGKFFMSTILEGLGISALALTKECNDFEIAELLIQEGADLYFKVFVGERFMPIVELEESADAGDIKFAELFHKRGVPIEYMTSEYFDNSPKELLVAAQKKGNEVLISFLKKNGYHC